MPSLRCILNNYKTILIGQFEIIMNSIPSEKFLITKKIDDFFIGLYSGFQFALRFFKEVFKPPYEFKEIIKQCYEVGYKSLGLITLTGFITGLVFTKQSRPSLSEFGASSWLPSLVAIAIIRALAPLVTALICSGKVGSQIGAELGSMKVTEQIDAMEVSATNPFKYLVVVEGACNYDYDSVADVLHRFCGNDGRFS